jgi:hypothetical protein
MTVGFVFSGSRQASDYVLCAINAAFISLSSNGGYDMIRAAVEAAGEEEDNR